ncbi:hypothetical protein BGX23_005040 [Mortierella sp. AD031]|nr:hypothetical protein BGX23_005040 [Mortierella sp. AD031]
MPSTDILPFCVGLAKNPVRARIFRNKMTCDINGFRTPFIFIAHTKKDARHAAYPICSGLTPPPLSSSMIFSGISTCAIREFKTDISFFESGSKGTNFDVDGLHESMTVWLSTNKEMALLKNTLAKHKATTKKLSVSSPPDIATSRCAQDLIQLWSWSTLNPSKSFELFAQSNAGFVKTAVRDEFNHLVQLSTIRVGRVSVKGFVSVEMVIGSKVYAAVSLQGNIPISIRYVKVALQESLRTGRLVPVAGDKKQPDFVVALVQDTVVTMGGSQYFAYPL